MELQQVLVKPIITEKSTLLQENGKYVFHVAPRANKIMIKEAVQKAFGVTVIDVNICKVRGKEKRYGPRLIRTPDVKKAIVTLLAGDRIQLIEGL
ncbi:MAG: 50S ribosomal protein L23 [Dehalococcoidia bacterium]|nr:50S ribosomal protein L23 [Chloroflexota bacterium]MCZ6867629.1 50S ribosomal protein L23 [Chloroflexota bacterium]